MRKETVRLALTAEFTGTHPRRDLLDRCHTAVNNAFCDFPDLVGLSITGAVEAVEPGQTAEAGPPTSLAEAVARAVEYRKTTYPIARKLGRVVAELPCGLQSEADAVVLLAEVERLRAHLEDVRRLHRRSDK